MSIHFAIRTCPVCGRQWTAEGHHRPPTGPPYCAQHKTIKARDQHSRNAVAAQQWGRWRDQAACAGSDPDVFFRQDTADAMELCSGCPVKADCAAEAIANGERAGVWGGVHLVPSGSDLSKPSRRALREVAGTRVGSA